MFSKKKILLPLLALPFLFSCNKPNIPDEPYINDPTLVATVESEMDCVKDNNLNNYVKEVKFGDLTLNFIGKDGDIKSSNGYFFSTDNEHPIYSWVKDPTVTINGESSVLNFYVCHYVISESGSECVHVSDKYQIIVKNSKALKPWVLWTVGTVVVVACAAMVYFTKRYKEKHG